MAKRPAPFTSAASLKAALATRALEEGFSKMGICAPDARPDLPEKLRAFLAEGYHGSMEWMADRAEWRANPAALWPEATSVIMLAELYTPDHDPRAILKHPDMGAISVYAMGKDYHDLVKRRLKRLGRWLIDQRLEGHEHPKEIKVFVDTAPVMEKPLAAAAGLGWQGKHTNVLARDLGNWFFLGAIFTNIDLPKDAPAVENCGSCRACLDACPTGAFVGEGRLDARRCVSYLTIEHKGPVDLELRARMGNRIYGCDDCLAACPWNKFASPAVDPGYGAKHPPATLAELAALDDAGFRDRYAGSPIKRIGRDRFVRNVLYAIGNSQLPQLAASAAPHLTDPDPVVAEAAAWAIAQLTPKG